MLLLAFILLVLCSCVCLANISAGFFTCEVPRQDGKLHHDMRTFLNVAVDWSLQGTNLAIPACHEYQIRRPYFDRPPMKFDMYDKISYDKSDHFVYPLVLTVTNASRPELQKTHYAAAVHKIYSREGLNDAEAKAAEMNSFELLTVTKKTWSFIQEKWRELLASSSDTCKATPHFNHLLRRIYRDAQVMPQYDSIVKNYTEFTSSVCDRNLCYGPQNQRETMTYAYPSQESVAEMGVLYESGVRMMRIMGYSRGTLFLTGYYTWDGQSERTSTKMESACQCIFLEPYC